MNKNLFFALALTLVGCGPAQLRPETVDLDRDELWNRCSFYVVDRQCGTVLSPEEQRECALEVQADYLTVSPGRRVFHLRTHGCPRHVLSR